MFKNEFQKNFKKITFLTLTLAFFTSGVNLYATEARSAGMGITTANENTWAVENQLPYIYTNPAALSSFGPMIFGEYGVIAGSGRGGAILQLGSSFNLGVFAGQSVDTAPFTAIRGNYAAGTDATTIMAAPIIGAFAVAPTIATWTNVYATAPTSGLTQQNASLMGSFKLGTMVLGVGFNFGRTANDNTAENTKPTPVVKESLTISEMLLKPTIGAAFDLGRIKLDASVALAMNVVNNVYSYNDSTNKNTADISYTNSGIGDILIDAQGIFDMGKSKLHVAAGFDILNRSATTKGSFDAAGTKSTAEDNYSNSGFNIKAGISDEINFSESILGFVGVGFKYTSITTKSPHLSTTVIGGTTTKSNATNDINTDTVTPTMMLPVFFGMEANITDKWQGRFGLTANLLNISSTGNTTTTQTKPTATNNSAANDTWNNSGTTFSAGVSFKLPTFTFDWNISVDLLTKGPFFIGGSAGAGPGMATDFAVSYKFGGN